MDVSFVSIEQAPKIDGTAVVVDVLRAYSTAACAFERGADRIVLCAEVDEALEVKAAIAGALACKDGLAHPGFELSNSPAQMLRLDMTGRTIVQRTQAGTVGARAAHRASLLLCCGFVNATATASRLRRLREDCVSFVISGAGGTAEEDLACAELIAARIEDPGVAADPFINRAHASDAADKLRRLAGPDHPGVDADDVPLCLQVDRMDFSMEARAELGRLTLRPQS